MSVSKSKPVITKLVLINLHIAFDSGRRTLKGISKKVAEDNDADVDMINTSISVIPKDKITPFTTAVSRARDYYKTNSLPWEDGNWRVLPVSKLQGFKDDLEKLISAAKDEFERCFILKYDDIKDLFDKRKGKIAVSFPGKEELEEAFSIEYNLGAIASTDDIRIVGIDTAMRNQIKKETEERYNDQINRGLQELAQNLLGAIEEISDRVSEDDQKGKKYTRFLDNLKGMTQTVDELNVTKNESLTKSCEMIRANISNWSPEAIKDNPEVRKSIKSASDGIREELLKINFDSEESPDEGNQEDNTPEN